MAQRELHVLNLGAGVQSTFLYLAWDSLNLPPLHAAVFADTQEEPVEVYKHLEWLIAQNRAPVYIGTKGKLGDHLKRGVNSTGGRFASIPAFTLNEDKIGKTRRQCSKEYKIEVIGKVIRQDILSTPPGRSPKGVTVHQYFGISLDEAGRASRLRAQPCPKYVQRHFPLVENFITRANCLTWLSSHVPHQVPRSACVFCPYHNDDEWLRIKGNAADWRRAVEIDEALRIPGNVVNRKMDGLLYLHKSCKPLVQIDFQPVESEHTRQGSFHFAPECLGVCGV